MDSSGFVFNEAIYFHDETETEDPLKIDDEEEEEITVHHSNTRLLWETYTLYFSLFLLLSTIFCILRKRYPNIYKIRNWVKQQQQHTHFQDDNGYVDWVPYILFHVSDEEILEHCGMDALCLDRIFYLGFKLALCASFNALWLAPIYGTACNNNESSSEATTARMNDTIVKASVSGIPSYSPRLFGTTFAAYILFWYTMHLILKDFQWFTDMRIKWLSQAVPRNYSIFLQGVPKSIRSNTTLRKYFEERLSKKDIVEVQMRLDLPALAEMISSRKNLVQKFERAIYMKQIKGKIARNEDSLQDSYMSDIHQLNQKITQRIDAIELKKESRVFIDLTEEHNTEGGLATQMRLEHEPLRELSGCSDMHPWLSAVLNPGEESTSEQVQGKNSGESQEKLKPIEVETESDGQWQGTITPVIDTMKFGFEDGRTLDSGFVTFGNLRSKQTALQIVHHRDHFTMNISEAPDPKDILWANIGKSYRDLFCGALVSFLLTTVTCIFWTVPVVFVSSIFSVRGLRHGIQFVDAALNAAPFLETVFAHLAPLLLIMFNALLPPLLELISRIEFPVSQVILQLSLLKKTTVFVIIQSVFVSAISGSILSELNKLTSDAYLALDMIANSIPSHSIFFVQLILAYTIFGMGLELLRMIPLTITWIHGTILTGKEKDETWLVQSPLSDPSSLKLAPIYSLAALYFMVLFVYSTISPITALVFFPCFLILSVGYRHQLIYIYPVGADSGGKLWVEFIEISLLSMVVAQISILVLLGLKKAIIAAGLMVPLIAGTLIFRRYIRQYQIKATKYIPSKECIALDLKNGKNRGYDIAFKCSYVQPELQTRILLPENISSDETSQSREANSFSALEKQQQDMSACKTGGRHEEFRALQQSSSQESTVLSSADGLEGKSSKDDSTDSV